MNPRMRFWLLSGITAAFCLIVIYNWNAVGPTLRADWRDFPKTNEAAVIQFFGSPGERSGPRGGIPDNAFASEEAKGMGPPGVKAAYRRTWRGRRCWVSVTFDKGGAVLGYAQGPLLSPLEVYLQ